MHRFAGGNSNVIYYTVTGETRLKHAETDPVLTFTPHVLIRPELHLNLRTPSVRARSSGALPHRRKSRGRRRAQNTPNKAPREQLLNIPRARRGCAALPNGHFV
ncbi:hypothetical protein EVAR_39703_1 [Eumeta japonica]|uniref:Uncharacterized protein n=1 Tax=Eumeta variegata TaxID=151549 RepID=A0A4C1W468_EUMVA|nr:hypothetical protein EVAR_39703_1 [Eumeta japonica]